MFKKVAEIGVMVIGITLLWGCGGDNSQNLNNAAIKDKSFSVSIALPPGEKDSIARAEVVITGRNMDTMHCNLTIGTDRVYGTVHDIPLGTSRHIEIKLYDTGNIMIYYGDAYADIVSDKTIDVKITIKCLKGSINVIGTIGEDSDQPFFTADSGTVFLADFNNNLKDFITGDSGSLIAAKFVPSLFHEGVQYGDSLSTMKSIYRFPATQFLSLTTGTLEAICYAKSVSSDYMHIIDKSWLYGITVYNGSLAVNFGSGWWYSGIAIRINQWNYVCGSYDGTTIRLYVNGECVAHALYTGFSGDSSYELGIGNAAAGSHDVPFKGIIDEIRISKIVRSDSEIATRWAAIGKKIAGN